MADLRKMGAFRAWVGAVFLYASITCSDGAAPANDNFADRLALQGTSVEINGSLSGATLENTEQPYPPILEVFQDDSSVWFSWRAPATGLALLRGTVEKTPTAVIISTGTTLSAAQQPENVLAERLFLPNYQTNRHAIFNAQADVEYQIRVCGMDVSSFNIVLGLTNHPVILEQPRSRTATPGANAFFSIGTLAYPSSLTTIQWQFNGTNLPGRLGPILAFTNATPELAGEYRAVATSANGNGGFISRTSSVAQLFVKQPAIPILSVRLEPRGVFADIQGDVGRSYLITTMGGLNPAGCSEYLASSDIFPVRLDGQFSGTTIGEAISVQVQEPVNNICDLNLKRIHFAKRWLVADRNLTSGDAYTENDLKAYYGEDLECPQGGAYPLTPIGTSEICASAFIGHLLEMQEPHPWWAW